MKLIKEKMKKILSGLVYLKGKNWFEYFYDKIEFVVIYCYWVLRNCE